MTFTIADMCAAGRTTKRGVYWWEQQGLLPDVERAGNNYRRYSAEHIRRARIIAACQMMNVKIEGIKVRLDYWDANWRENIVGGLKWQIKEIEALIANLPIDEPELDL